MRLFDKLWVLTFSCLLLVAAASFTPQNEMLNAYAQDYQEIVVQQGHDVVQATPSAVVVEHNNNVEIPEHTNEEVLNQAGVVVVGVTSKTLSGMALALAISKLLLFLVMSPIGSKLMPFIKSSGWQMVVALSLTMSVSVLTLMSQGSGFFDAILNGGVVTMASELIYQIIKKTKKAVA